MLNQGFVLLHRSILDWEWYSDLNTRALFLHLLVTANYEDKDWMGINIKRGERVYSRAKLSSECGISEQSVRTALKRLISTGEVTSRNFSKYSIITISNYDKYQQPTSKSTSNQPATNQQLTSNQPQLNNIKKDNKSNKYNPPIVPLGFDELWKAYPRKQSKAAAQKSYRKLDPDGELLGALLSAVERQKKTRQWQEDGGKYIPLLSTWLNQRRWEDEEEIEIGTGTGVDSVKPRLGIIL